MASVLVLKELEGERFLPVFIGESETKAILLALEETKAVRPQTHDLFVNFMQTVRCSLKYVLAYRFFESIYYARLYFSDEKGDEFFVESRLSDAVALALRCKVSIYANEEVLDEAGISASQLKNEDSDDDSGSEQGEFAEYNNRELEELLLETVENEEFERAALIRDEINQRKKNNS
jgi:bifunctional DNase/RNase